jgi:hypothetical protein
MNQRARDRHALELTAGQFARHAGRAVRQADLGQQFCGATLAVLGCRAEQHQRQRHVLPDRQVRQDVECLEHEAQFGAARQRARRVVHCGDVGAVDDDRSVIGTIRPAIRLRAWTCRNRIRRRWQRIRVRHRCQSVEHRACARP